MFSIFKKGEKQTLLARMNASGFFLFLYLKKMVLIEEFMNESRGGWTKHKFWQHFIEEKVRKERK